MINQKIDYDIQKLHKTYDEIDNKVDEVRHNLSYNIEKCKKKKEKINSISSHKISVCLQMIKRERQLTTYVNSLTLKQKSINSKKKQFRNQTESQIQVLDEEIEKSNIQLQSIYKEKQRLIKKKQDLQNLHNTLSAAIQKANSALEEIIMSEVGKESLFSKNQLLTSTIDSNNTIQQKIEKRHKKIEQINDSTISVNKSIILSKIALQNAQINNQSIKAKIFCAQARLKEMQNAIDEFKSEVAKRQNDIYEKTINLKEEQVKLNNLKNTCQMHCESIRHELNSRKISENEVKKAINDKTVEISLKNDQINQIKVTIMNLKEEKEISLDQSIIKSNQLKMSSDRLIELNKNIQSIRQIREETETQLKKENINLQENKTSIEKTLPLVEQCIQIYNKIEVALQAETALSQLDKEIEIKCQQKLPNFNNSQEVTKEKTSIQQVIKLFNSKIESENSIQNKLIQKVLKYQNKVLRCQINKAEIKDQIKQTMTFDDPILHSINSDINIKKVTTLIESIKLKRQNRIERKKRDNETLQRRLNELIKRIDIRKRKMRRQLNSIEKEKDEFDFLPDEEKIVFKSIESLSELVNKELLLWNSQEENESLVKSWESKIDDLYNKLDEFILRK